MGKEWVLYILSCKDDTLYTGITDNLPRRLEQHRSGKGAKYTRGRAPLTLCYVEMCEDHSSALRREVSVKRLTKAQKLKLIQSYKETAAE